MLPEFTDEGELPPGVHIADWQDLQSRFCGSSRRRHWLSGRLRAILELVATTGETPPSVSSGAASLLQNRHQKTSTSS
jgi:hypothetical protein